MGVINPTRRLENRLFREQGHRVILGVDEVGVAPSAGPVVACALAMPLDKRFIKGVRDSKMLSAAQRDRLAKQILRQAIRVGHRRGIGARDRPDQHLLRDDPGHAARRGARG